MHSGHDAVSRFGFIGNDDEPAQALGVGGNECVGRGIVGGRDDERCIADRFRIVPGELDDYLLIDGGTPHQLLARPRCPHTDCGAAGREREDLARGDAPAADDKREH